MCHCHLLSAVETKCFGEVENEDTSTTIICIIDVPLLLTHCSGIETKCVSEGENTVVQ